MRWRNGVESVARVEKKASHYLRRTSTPRAQVREYFSRLLLPLVNYSLGSGFLATPYSFSHAGYLVAVPTLLVIVFVTWIHASWLLEVMAIRAQVRWDGVIFIFLVARSLKLESEWHPHWRSILSSGHPQCSYTWWCRYHCNNSCGLC